MNFIEVLQKKNRTLLEMHIGMVCFGILCQIAGLLCGASGLGFLGDQGTYALSLWLGILLAMLSAIHMYRTLERSLDLGDAAAKLIVQGYIIRYVLIVLIVLIIIITKILNPLLVFLGYMSLKVAALIQPFTHKLCNWIFHETDPEPEPLSPDCGQRPDETDGR